MNTKRITTNVKKVIENKRAACQLTYVITAINDFVLIGNDRVKPEHFKMMFPIELITNNIYL